MKALGTILVLLLWASNAAATAVVALEDIEGQGCKITWERGRGGIHIRVLDESVAKGETPPIARCSIDGVVRIPKGFEATGLYPVRTTILGKLGAERDRVSGLLKVRVGSEKLFDRQAVSTDQNGGGTVRSLLSLEVGLNAVSACKEPRTLEVDLLVKTSIHYMASGTSTVESRLNKVFFPYITLNPCKGEETNR